MLGDASNSRRREFAHAQAQARRLDESVEREIKEREVKARVARLTSTEAKALRVEHEERS